MSGSSSTWSTSCRSWMTCPLSRRIRLVRPRVGSVGRVLLPVDEETARGRVAAVEPQQVALALAPLALPVREELARGVVGAEDVPPGAHDVGRVGLDRVEQLLELLRQLLGCLRPPGRGAGRERVQVRAPVGVELECTREAVDAALARAKVAAALDEVVVGHGDVGELGDLGAAEAHPTPALGPLDA